jgi:SAM-dependent methyltransferase
VARVNAGRFWSEHPPGLKWLPGSSETQVTTARYQIVRATRYALEPHVEELAGFAGHSDQLVVEIGCGIGTDGTRFLEGEADYVGMDQSAVALRAARQTFDLLGLRGRLVQGDATLLPFRTASVDFVYAHGVLHHFPATQTAVEEIHRVLRPGGQCLVMLYHRGSLNYRLNILVLRRLGALLLLVPGLVQAVALVTDEPVATLQGHRQLLRRYGLRYLTDRQLFLSNNTDGPGNPLSKVFSRREAADLFDDFQGVTTDVRHLNLRMMPLLDRRFGRWLSRRLGRRWGWHLYVHATR